MKLAQRCCNRDSGITTTHCLRIRSGEDYDASVQVRLAVTVLVVALAGQNLCMSGSCLLCYQTLHCTSSHQANNHSLQAALVAHEHHSHLQMSMPPTFGVELTSLTGNCNMRAHCKYASTARLMAKAPEIVSSLSTVPGRLNSATAQPVRTGAFTGSPPSPSSTSPVLVSVLRI